MEPVTLKISGNECCISNGILMMQWKDDGTLGLLSRNGKELVRNLPDRSDTGKKSAFYVDYHAEGAFRRCSSPRLQVIENSGRAAHIAYVDHSGYLAVEYHIVLFQGESGYYSYVIGANNTDTPFELSEFRIVYRCGGRIYDHAYNGERRGLQPAHQYMEQFEKLQDETYRLPDGEKYTNGPVYSKYDYAGYFSENPVWGQYGHGQGFFVIPASAEYYPSGPMKQELLVHYDGIVLNYFTGSHFGTGNLHVPIGWKKFYGPFYQYFNEGETEEELIKDALRQAKEEREKWPYGWVRDDLYPLTRSHVSGRLLFGDKTPCRQATVILGRGELPVELQSAGYLYWTQTDENGCFVIPNVRFDTYSLFAYQTGGSNTHQLRADGIVVREREQKIGELVWEIPDEEVLWQIGKATRTCKGYRYSGELRNYKWMTMVPETVHFYIGESSEERDWYYAQTRKGSWFIHFKLDDVPEGDCVLTVAIAGASRGGTDDRGLPCLTVCCNGFTLREAVLGNDGAIYRSATLSGRYHCLKMTLAPECLRQGENIVELRVVNGMIMYDTVLLTKEKY